MREARTDTEKIIDKALYLSLLDMVADVKGNIIGDRIKCMKLAFLVEYPMFENRIKGFNCVFFRYDRGPISKNIYSIWFDLEKAGYIRIRNKNSIELTEEGHELAHEFIHDVLDTDANRFFFDAMKEVSNKYGRLDSISSVVYDMEVFAIELNERMKIKNVPKGITFTLALDDADARNAISVSSSWLETLAIALNPSNKSSVDKGLDDLRNNRVIPHKKVWAIV